MNGWAIRADDLGKFYFARDRRYLSGLGEAIAEAVRGAFRRPPFGCPPGNGATPGAGKPAPFWALRHVCFEARRGEALGVLGANGAGKTTLLRILARIALPSEGRAEWRGRVGALLEAGAGLHGELTGRENVHLYGAMLGMSKAETKQKFGEIVSFAGLDDFIHTPLKRYSTGMCLRLAFSVAAHFEPEVLLVDDVLGAADTRFQRTCLARMTAAAGRGRTVVLVSHDPEHVRSLCTRGIVLERGRVVYSGSAAGAADAYSAGAGPARPMESVAAGSPQKED